MKRRLSPILLFILYGAGAIVLAVGGVAIWKRDLISAIVENRDVLFQGAEWADRMGDEEGVLAYLAAHPDTVSFASWEVGREEEALLHHADTPRPLASTVKILVLSAYARAVEAGEFSPDEEVALADWEALLLPGTDGGAHVSAISALRAADSEATDGGATPRRETFRLAEVAEAMIVHSDNAATDLLMRRLGRARIDAEPSLLELPEGNEAPFPLNGSMLLAMLPPEGELPLAGMAEWAARGREAIRDGAWKMLERLATDTAFRDAQKARLLREGIGLNLNEQMTYARELNPRGTVFGYARVMERVVTASPESRWGQVMARHLEWPLRRSERLGARFDRFGTKGGSLPGVLTSATFATPKDGAPQVLALFLQDVPFAAWAAAMRSYAHQSLEQHVLSDPGFAQESLGRLRASDGGS